MLIGALEAGGTKMVCAIGDENGQIFDRISIPTEFPEETMPRMIDYYKSHRIEALGIGCFGPIDPVKGTEKYGYILATPKQGWRDYNIVGTFQEALGCPIGFDTDVNASMLGEATFGAYKGMKNGIYITVGTGIGIGVYVNGSLLHGCMHPEGGHIMLKPHARDTYRGKCPYHGTCLEGLAAGPAIMDRWGKPAAELADQKEVWEMEAYYLAQAFVDYTCLYAPERIICGGGVMKQRQLLPLIRKEFKKQMAGYLSYPALDDPEEFIVPESLDGNQGILGCLALANER